MSDPSLDHLRHDAKRLRKQYESGNSDAIARVNSLFPHRSEPLKHADFLHIIAKSHQFDSWPKLKFAVERNGLDKIELQRILRHALYSGQHWKIDELLANTPDLADGDLACNIVLFNIDAVREETDRNSSFATQKLFGKSPIVHLAFSKHLQAAPDKETDMIAIAQLLLDHGADVNDGEAAPGQDEHVLSVLYGALGHSNNMALAAFLLAHGANPNDGESLYHATELGHHNGLKMLLDHGAEPKGTNALLRALDFNDHKAVQMLLDSGAAVDDFNNAKVGGEAPYVIPVLHHAARRMNDHAMINLLLDASADPYRIYDGVTAYAFAKVIGNQEMADIIEARGLSQPLDTDAQLLANAAAGMTQKDVYLNPTALPECFRHLLKELITLPGKLDHIKRLVALGLEYDLPDAMGVPPVQTAGWNGLPEIMSYFLELGPDLSHVNHYGGTLLGTILHGAEHAGKTAERDHLECVRLALHHGVALPKAVLSWTGDEELSAFLKQWADEKPSQVI